MGERARATKSRKNRTGGQEQAAPATPATGAATAPATTPLVPGQAYGGFAVAPKLEVGSSQDSAEVEADRIADQVVEHLRVSRCCDDEAHRDHGSTGAGGEGGVRRSSDATATPEAPIGLAGGRVSADNEQRIESARSGGRGLPTLVRREMEGAFGTDFSAVRVHSGPEASELNRGMSAKAFTVGSDVFFRDGLPDTSSSAGAHLMAHELSHVVQHTGRASRSVVRRDPQISGPRDVKVRTGQSSEPVPIDNRAQAQQAFGSRMNDPKKPLQRGKAAGDLDVAGDQPLQEDPQQQGSTAPAPMAMPSLSAIVIPGVDAKMEADDPFKAATAHEKYAGKLLQSTQTSDGKVEAFSRFVEADYVRINAAHHQYQALGLQPGDPKKTAKKKKELEDSVGAEKLKMPAGADRSIIWTIVLDLADERNRLAAVARKNANDDVPLVDSVYEMARDEKKAIQALTGGRSIAHAADRLSQKSAAGNHAGQQKHHGRMQGMSEASSRAQKLGGSVREAYLSESRLAVKAAELADHKGRIEDAKTFGQKASALGKTVGKAVIGTGVSIASAGLVTAQEDSTNKGALGSVGMKPVLLWQRLEAEFDKAADLIDKQPYGAATSFHAGLQIFNAVLREIRNVIGGLGLLIGLLGTAVGLVAPPVGAAIAGVGVTMGLVALGITLFKVVIEAVLASWSGLQRAFTSNARNNNLLTGQARSQAAEGLVDTVSAAGSFAVPAATNAAFSGDGGHGLNGLIRPDEYLTGAQQIGAVAAPVTANVGMQVGQGVMQVGSNIATGVGSNVLASEVVQDDDQKRRDANKKPGARALPPRPTGPRPAATAPAVEPQWIKDARESEGATRDAGMDVLLKKHTRNISQFHDKTQALMLMQRKQKAEATAAQAKLATAKQPKAKDDEGVLGTVEAMSAKSAAVLGTIDAQTAVMGNPKTLQEKMIEELKGKLAARGGPRG